jgi:hypothetical protein
MSKLAEELAKRLKLTKVEEKPVPEPPRRVGRDIYEELYWSAAQRAMNPPPKAQVVSEYNPFSTERMNEWSRD